MATAMFLCPAMKRIDESKVYVGCGTYSHDAVHLTDAGLAAGWKYQYPHGISLNGVNVYDLGLSLTQLIELGYADWHTTTTTLC